MPANELKASEEQKRDATYDPALRWRHIQDTITWAEANLPEHLRRNRPRRPKPWRSGGFESAPEAKADPRP